jgi:hypothetical protein
MKTIGLHCSSGFRSRRPTVAMEPFYSEMQVNCNLYDFILIYMTGSPAVVA